MAITTTVMRMRWQADGRRLWLALGLILGFMAVEVVAGILASSLALLSDAAHMLTDAGAIALALAAAAPRPRARPRGASRSGSSGPRSSPPRSTAPRWWRWPR